MGTIRDLCKLRRDPELIFRFSDTPFQNNRYTQGRSYFPQIFILAFELKRGCAGNNFKIGDLNQNVDDLFGYAISKLIGVKIIAEIERLRH